MICNVAHFLNYVLRLLVVVTVGCTLNACSPKCTSGRKLEGGVCVSAAGSRDAGEERGLGMISSDTQMTQGELGPGISGGTGAVAGQSSNTSGHSSLPHAATGGADASSGAADMTGGATGMSGSSGQQMDGASTEPQSPIVDAGAQSSDASDGTPACEPALEQCDGKDNDCDTNVDEAIEPMTCGMNIGICKQGTVSCRDGKWDDPTTQCEGAVWPSSEGELCDSERRDENCDGMPNEGCDCDEGESQECGEGPYTCKKGTVTCRGGRWSACEGEQKGSAEMCDGEDNDCNGRVDDGGDSLCSGRRCSGRSGCVECVTDADCGNRSAPACKVSACDASRHVCVNRNAEDGSSCGGSRTCDDGRCVACATSSDCEDRTCQNKTCSSGECMYTSVRLGDPHSTCPDNRVCSANRACVECVGGIQCESRGPGNWVCASNMCKITAESNCTGKEGVGCSTPCSTTSDCPSAPGSGVVTCASNSAGNWCQYSCQNTNSDCPSSMYCGTFICLFN